MMTPTYIVPCPCVTYDEFFTFVTRLETGMSTISGIRDTGSGQ